MHYKYRNSTHSLPWVLEMKVCFIETHQLGASTLPLVLVLFRTEAKQLLEGTVSHNRKHSQGFFRVEVRMSTSYYWHRHSRHNDSKAVQHTFRSQWQNRMTHTGESLNNEVNTQQPWTCYILQHNYCEWLTVELKKKTIKDGVNYKAGWGMRCLY